MSISISQPEGDKSMEGESLQAITVVSEEELVKIMAANTLHDDPLGRQIEHSTKLVKAFLLKYEPEFVRVMEFRNRVTPILPVC
jgi:hypothetical protein